MNTKRVLTAAAVALAAVSLVPLAGSPASAATRRGCPYPNVCFYLTKADYDSSHPTAMYKDVTSGYQTLGSQSRGAYAAVNTRSDDRAMIGFRDSSGTYVTCLPPNQTWAPIYQTVLTVRIDTAANCPTGP